MRGALCLIASGPVVAGSKHAPAGRRRHCISSRARRATFPQSLPWKCRASRQPVASHYSAPAAGSCDVHALTQHHPATPTTEAAAKLFKVDVASFGKRQYQASERCFLVHFGQGGFTTPCKVPDVSCARLSGAWPAHGVATSAPMRKCRTSRASAVRVVPPAGLRY